MSKLNANHFALFSKFMRFGVVGASGVLVNLSVFSAVRALTKLSDSMQGILGFTIAEVAGIAVSVATNFILNDRWTWARERSAMKVNTWRRFGRFCTVAAIAGGVNLACAITVRSNEWGAEIVAVLAGIAAATAVNFILNDRWTFEHGDNTRAVGLEDASSSQLNHHARAS